MIGSITRFDRGRSEKEKKLAIVVSRDFQRAGPGLYGHQGAGAMLSIGEVWLEQGMNKVALGRN